MVTVGVESEDNLFEKFSKWIKTTEPNVRLPLLSVVIGIIGGFSMVLLRNMIEFAYHVIYLIPRNNGPELLAIVCIPAFGGLLVGYINYSFGIKHDFAGVSQIIKVVNVDRGKMRARIPFLKFISTALTLGTGGSAGREGPIAQISGGFAAVLTNIFDLKVDEKKDLIIGGVGAGIAAAFNAPLGGLLFGLEIIRRDKRILRLVPLIISSVVGSTVTTYFFATAPYSIGKNNTFSIQPLPQIPFYIVIGVITGLLSLVWILGFYRIETLFDKVPMSRIILPAFGGLMVGGIEIFYPNVAGFEQATSTSIHSALLGRLSLIAAFSLFGAKFIATSLTLGSGGSGGELIPTLFMGAMLGDGIGQLMVALGYHVDVSLFAVLGMAAFFAGTARAPLTAILLTSEIIGDFKIIIPLMFCVVSAWVVSKYIFSEDTYSIKFYQNGIPLGSEFEDVLDEIYVRDVMIREPLTVSPKDRLEHIIYLMQETGHTGYPVIENGRIVGIITEHDVDNALRSKDLKDWNVGDISTRRVVCTLPDTPISQVLDLMAAREINRMPVIKDHISKELVGWITRSDLLRAYLKERQRQAHEIYEDQLFEVLDQKGKQEGTKQEES